MKTCFKCNQSKPETEFYRHSQMGDGLLGKCKECTKADVKARRLKRLEYYRDYDRKRGKLPHRLANAKRVTKNWRTAHPGRNAAHLRARRHHRKAPASCQMCGLEKKRLERHHPDYSLPLLIVWLCKPCHVIADRARRAQETP